jgi:hypothetical protein
VEQQRRVRHQGSIADHRWQQVGTGQRSSSADVIYDQGRNDCCGGGSATAVVSARVAALAEGVLKAMFLSKLRLVAALLLGVCVLGAGLLTSSPFYGAQEVERKAPVAASTSPSESSDRKFQVPIGGIGQVLADGSMSTSSIS